MSSTSGMTVSGSEGKGQGRKREREEKGEEYLPRGDSNGWMGGALEGRGGTGVTPGGQGEPGRGGKAEARRRQQLRVAGNDGGARGLRRGRAS